MRAAWQWAASTNGKLVGIDPDTNGVVSRREVGDYSFDVAAGAGSAWVLSEVGVNSMDGYTTRLTRLGLGRDAVSEQLDRANTSGLTVGGGVIWVGIGDAEKGEGGLIKITP